MQLKALYDTDKEIPEAVRALYTEKSGKWR